MNMDGLRGFHYEAIADAIVCFEDHQRSRILFGQRYGATAEAVVYRFACLKNGKNISDRQAVVGTAVQNNNHGTGQSG